MPSLYESLTVTDRLVLTEAAELELHGDFNHAQALLDALRPGAREHPASLAVRLVAALGLEKWSLGAEIAERMAVSPIWDDRELAGRFYLAHARMLFRTNKREEAVKAVRKLTQCWPQCRLDVLNDPSFKPLFE